MMQTIRRNINRRWNHGRFLPFVAMTLALACMAGTLRPKPTPANPLPLRKPKREIESVVEGFLWIDAEDFADYGGWWLDTQFVHLMGSARPGCSRSGSTTSDGLLSAPGVRPPPPPSHRAGN